MYYDKYRYDGMLGAARFYCIGIFLGAQLILGEECVQARPHQWGIRLNLFARRLY